MVKVFMGLPGSGKTKHLVELINNAVDNELGNVVCIEKGQKLRFDLHRNVKLVDITLLLRRRRTGNPELNPIMPYF